MFYLWTRAKIQGGKMKKFCSILFLVVFPLIAGEITKTVTFAREDLIFSKVNEYDVIELKGYPALIDPGKPRVPRAVQALLIPAGATPTTVEIVVEDWGDLPGSYNVFPAQPDVRLPMPGKIFTPEEYSADPKVYASENPYPEVKIRLSGVGSMSGYRIAHIEIFPVRFIPATGNLKFARRITYRLKYVEHQVTDIIATFQQREIFGAAVHHIVVNPEDVARFAPRVVRGTRPSLLPPDDYEYVVISEPPMDTVFQRLADWKTKKGIPATVVTVSWINSNYTGYDLREKIRNFIIDAQENWGTIYVLLGGSGDQRTSGQNIVPARLAWYCRVDDSWTDSIPSDLYYSDLDGTWDENGNHVWGERIDNIDMYADIYVGRASVYTVAMAQNFVSKVMTYEMNPPTDYIKKMLLPTAILWSSYDERPMQDSIARMTPAGWFDAKLYERHGTLSRQAMIDSLNMGYAMGHWVGHGNQHGIYKGGGPYLNSTDANNLINGDKQGIANSIGCMCGAWDLTPGGDCFAEHLVNRVGGGLIAAIMNSRYGYGAWIGYFVPGPSERIDTTFYANIFHANMYHCGQVHAVAKDVWVPYADSGGEHDMTRWCIYELNLFGDPELPLWTDIPQTLTVNYPASIPTGNQNVNITVTSSGSPVNNALVCLKKMDETYARGYTDAAGAVTLNVYPTSLGFMEITVTAKNHYPFEDSLLVQASNYAHISYLKCYISDPAPGGNNDGILNPDESVELPLWVKNWGQTQGNNIIGTLSSTDTFVTLFDTIKNFGNIPADDSAYTGADGYNLDVSPTCPDGHSIQFTLICKDDVDSTWTSHFNLSVYAPVLIFQEVNVQNDDNGNNMLEPGETAELVVTIENKGGATAENVTSTLISASSYITINDNAGYFGSIEPDSTGTNSGDPYNVTASNSTPYGVVIDFQVEVVSDFYVDTLEFGLLIGTPGADYATHDVGNCKLTVTRYGAIGFMNIDGSGEGFCYPITSGSCLYYGSFAAGTDVNYCVDRFYTGAGFEDTDWETSTNPDGKVRMYEPGSNDRDEYATACYLDAGHSSPKDLRCLQYSWAWDDAWANDFVIMKFSLINEGVQTLTDLYAAVFLDWDVSNYQYNQGASDTSRNLTWMYQYTPYVGVAILDPPREVAAANLAFIDHEVYVYQGNMSDDIKIQFMNGTIQYPSTNRPADWSVCNSAGPFTLDPGKSAVAAFAIIGGDDLDDLKANADTAYDRYWNWPGVEEQSSDVTISGVVFYPVISRGHSYTLRYGFTQKTPLNIKVYDITGRLVASHNYGERNGSGELKLHLKSLAQGVYFIKIEAGNTTKTTKIIWLR